MFKWYIDDANRGITETKEEAEEILTKAGLIRTYISVNNTKYDIEYWTETGEMDEDDDGVYTPKIQEDDEENKKWTSNNNTVGEDN